MKNRIGLKIGMAGIVLVPLHLCIFNNHNPSHVFAQAKANATSIHHPFAIVIGDCDIGSLVFVAPTAVCRAISVTWGLPQQYGKTHIEYRLDMGEDAGVYEELKQLKFNVEVLRKTGWSGLVQKPLIFLRRTIGMIDNRSPISNWGYRKKRSF